MKTLYIDCGMGAAGDMLSAALYELLSEEEKEQFLQTMNHLGLEDVQVYADASKKCGIAGTHMRVVIHGGEEGEHHDHHEHHEHHGEAEEHHHEHHHATMADIQNTIRGFDVSDKVKQDALAVYELLAAAESKVHQVPVTEIHFHEVGRLDAIADITAVCLLMEMLSPQQVIASPICVGDGFVRCAHGILPVPAPAVAELLQGIPMYKGRAEVELCTPTGAALLRYFVGDYGAFPVMRTDGVGYGMGKKDLPWANCVRIFAGEVEAGGKDCIVALSCNVDDMTGESVGFATEQLLAAGAKEVYTIPIQMKKNRPGILLTVLCHVEDEAQMVRKIFGYTTTIGIRKQTYERYVLNRKEVDLETEEGVIRRKDVEGYGVSRSKLEYEDVARLARKYGTSLEEAKTRL